MTPHTTAVEAPLDAAPAWILPSESLPVESVAVAALPDASALVDAVSTPTSPAALPAGPRRTDRLRARFGGFGGPFWVVIGGTAVNRVGNMVLPFLVFFLGSRHIATDRIPFVLGALGLGGLLGPVLGGLLTDRLGSRAAMVTGMIGTAASQGLLFAAPNLATLTLAAVALGAAGSLHLPGAATLVAGATGPERRRVAFGLFHWSINVGTAVAGAIGGFLAEHGYGLLFALDAATCLGYALLAATLLPRSAGRAADRRAAADGGGYRVVLRDRLLLSLLLPIVLAEGIYAQTEFTLPLAIRDHALPATVFGLAAVVNALLVVTLQPIASVWLVRFDRLRLWSVAIVLVSAGVALTGIADSAWGFALTVVVWSLGEVFASGLYTSIVADLAPADAQGRYQGASGWARGLARLVALVLGSAVYAGLGPAALWWSCAVLGLVGAGLPLLLSRAVRGRTAAAAG
ncbi:MFS transporter [Kitasatospora sp. NBC_01250]|uniref:MFS transporter n=1 Tax=unclassified Kitasatospora TaxID=2633591 RepID=UPI002E0F1059|nr:MULTISPECIES: MFS transporter [unclassified Kitasatospora]WSJ66922.1 MFS transporter [Kitasatospora sp. NBC_01302]